MEFHMVRFTDQFTFVDVASVRFLHENHVKKDIILIKNKTFSPNDFIKPKYKKHNMKA